MSYAFYLYKFCNKNSKLKKKVNAKFQFKEMYCFHMTALSLW